MSSSSRGTVEEEVEQALRTGNPMSVEGEVGISIEAMKNYGEKKGCDDADDKANDKADEKANGKADEVEVISDESSCVRKLFG